MVPGRTPPSRAVSHLWVRDVAVANEASSDAVDGLDPAGTWTVVWGGNVQIRPIGLYLDVQTQ